MKKWTENEVKRVAELYQKYPLKIIASITEIPYNQLKWLINNRKLLSGRTCKFQKGFIPWNKGKRYKNLNNCTKYKSGNIPHNTKPEGYQTIRKDKRGVPYYFLKFRGRIDYKHRIIWELAHGAIPEGYLVVFVDGDTMNCTIENLMIISKTENIRRNGNRVKAAETLRKIYRREKVRKKYGLSPLTKHYDRIKNF